MRRTQSLSDVPGARPSSTVVLVRESDAAPELLMMRRHERSSFGGAYAFPGGVLESGDDEVAEWCDGITAAEAAQIIQGLETIRQEIEAGRFRFNDSLEDIHMHIESRLIEIAGPVGRKLHTARSRNDQVALDVRMYLRAAASDIVHRLHRLRQVLVDLAKKNIDEIVQRLTEKEVTVILAGMQMVGNMGKEYTIAFAEI